MWDNQGEKSHAKALKGSPSAHVIQRLITRALNNAPLGGAQGDDREGTIPQRDEDCSRERQREGCTGEGLTWLVGSGLALTRTQT